MDVHYIMLVRWWIPDTPAELPAPAVASSLDAASYCSLALPASDATTQHKQRFSRHYETIDLFEADFKNLLMTLNAMSIIPPMLRVHGI